MSERGLVAQVHSIARAIALALVERTGEKWRYDDVMTSMLEEIEDARETQKLRGLLRTFKARLKQQSLLLDEEKKRKTDKIERKLPRRNLRDL